MEHTHDHHNNHNHNHNMNLGEHIFLGWALFCLALFINQISISFIKTLFAMVSIPLWSFDWLFVEHAMSMLKFIMTMITMSASLFVTYKGYRKNKK